MAPGQQDAASGGGKFGKFLAVGMAIALIWGILLTLFGIQLRFSFGGIISNSIGEVESQVRVQSAVSESGQNIVPITKTIAKDVDMGTWSQLLAGITLTAGILIILFSCLGIFGGLKHNRVVLIVTVVILLVAVLLLLGLISIMADPDASFHSDAKNELIDKLHKEYTVETTDNNFVLAMNTIMLWFQCCGINGVRDFQNLTFTEILPGQQAKEYIFKVAPACCMRDLFNAESELLTPFVRIRDCAVKGYDIMPNLNNMGCYRKLLDLFSTTATAVLALIFIWNIIVLVLVILTIMEIKPEEEGVYLREKEREEEEVEAPTVKKFIPFAKISSFVHPDVNRIKSTEIW